MGRRGKYLAVAFAGLLAASLGYGRIAGQREEAGEERAVARVERGTLEVKVVATGSLVAPRSVTIASEIQSNRAKVVGLTPEGSLVKEKDLLVEFDPTPFLEDVTKYTRAVKEAEANLKQAEQDVKLQAARAAQLLEDAEQRGKVAKIEIETLEGGGGALSAQEAKARVDESGEELLQARQRFGDAEALLGQGFITRAEYEQAEARLRQAERSRDLAMAANETLVQYRQPAERERARMALKRAGDEIRRLRETTAFEKERQEALKVKAETALEAARADLGKAETALEKSKVFSPASGILVYNEVPLGSEYRKIQVGDSVWQGQAILTIPDTSQMAVETYVRESDVHKLHSGQAARVGLEAFPELSLVGRVDFIGNLATQRGAQGRGKHFSLRVALEETRAELRPGMTAEVEIDVDRVPDALLLPIEAVFERGGRTTCTAVRGGTQEEREVKIGKSNNDTVVILSGVEEGETVSLVPRGRKTPKGER